MSWQHNREMQSTSSRKKGAAIPLNDSTTDSSILRYIKKLTNHHANAKQQRMDRYLQHVKHAQSAETSTLKVPKPPKFPPTTASQRQLLDYKSEKTMVKLGRKSQVRNDRSNPQQVAEFRSHLKRPHEENQSNRQLKQLKEALGKQQTTINGSFDRFRLQGASSQKSLKPHNVENPSDKSLRVDTTTKRQHVQTKTQLQSLNMKNNAVGNKSNRRFFQALKPPPVMTKGLTQVPSSNVIGHANMHEAAQPEHLCNQQEVLIPTYDPHSSIMESVYF